MPRITREYGSCLLALALMLPACQPADDTPAAAASWQVDPQPTLMLTSDRLPEGHELNGIYAAHQLPAGSLLIANSGAHELLLVDSLGRFSRTIGRKGQGPGEYSGDLHLFQDVGDTIVVYDGGSKRWTFLTPELELARTVSDYNAEIPSPSWLYRGSLVSDATIRQERDHARDILTRARSRDPSFEHLLLAKQDAQGATWVRRLENAREWEVYQGADSTFAQVTLPPGLELLSIGTDALVGVAHDSLGEETIQVHRLARPPGNRAPLAPAALPDPPMAQSDMPPLGRELRNLVVTQEGYYSDHASYATVADSLRARLEGGARLFLLYGDKNHWGGVAVIPASGVTCGITVG
ncbi:MAG: hypothetical protein HKM89_05545, partial [Gemmatimonadales bacterium]|nr:hypothetical protein [Gemmatimonadales bacterium]